MLDQREVKSRWGCGLTRVTSIGHNIIQFIDVQLLASTFTALGSHELQTPNWL